MNTFRSGSDLKSEAREYLAGKYVFFAVSVMVYLCAVLMIDFLFSGAASALFAESPATNTAVIIHEIVYFIASSALSVLIAVFTPGIYLICLKIYAMGSMQNTGGNVLNLTDLFYGFRHDFRKNLLIAAATILPRLLLLEPFSFYSEKFSYSGNLHDLRVSAVFLLFGLLLCIPVELMLSMSFFISIDFPAYSASEALRQSIALMKAHWKSFLYLQCSFLPVLLLSVCSLGIGLIWAIPYIDMTQACFYMDRMKPANANP